MKVCESDLDLRVEEARSENGQAAAGGNTADVDNAFWTNTIGEPELIKVWTDPDFDPSVRAYTSPLWYVPCQ